ncbi:MAG: hypothetical protein LBC80_02420 [Treponema sp.]|jgi:hypothetical protein|nr:hypothetical protein [Treponema sp.]
MKKIIAVAVFLFAVMVIDVVADSSLLNVNRYFRLFPIGRNQDVTDNDYVWTSADEDYGRFSGLGEHIDVIDTPLEFALLSYYSPPVINIRPVQADAILPANNPKLADLKLGAAVFKEIQILRFLNASGGSANTAAVDRHEGVLKFITDRGNVTRAEVEEFYRNGIRAFIAEIVDEEFNRISFLLNNATTNPIRGHNSVMTRNPQNGHYTLSYGGAYTNNETRIITANALEALSSEMRNGRHRADFDQTGINAVRAQAALIPAVRLSGQAIDDIKTILTAFYTNPNTSTYNIVRDVFILFNNMSIRDGGQPVFRAINSSYARVLHGFNYELGEKVIGDSLTINVARNLTQDEQRRLVELR